MMFLALIGSFLSSPALAVPQKLTQQGRLLDSTGNPLFGVHDITFRLYDNKNGGSPLWTEVSSQSFNNGYFSVILGADSNNNPLDSATLSIEPLYLEIQIDSEIPMAPRIEIVSQAYSRLSGVAESVDGGTVNATSIAVNGNIVVDTNGEWIGSQSMNWNEIDPQSIPNGLDDGDNVLTEEDVEIFVINESIALATGSSIAGEGIILTESSTIPWTNIDPNTLPSGL